jgi:tetratricopeptide (TPR) repeat protein
MWSSHYDRDLDDIFSIQSDIAASVTDSLKVTLMGRERTRMQKRDTENPAAYVAYLKGRTLLHDRSEKAIKGAKEQFELAISEDPSFARAYSGLADTYMLLGDFLFLPVPPSLAEAKTYIQKALELDPDLPEARVSLANLQVYEYDFLGAEIEFRKAISLNPSYATAHHSYASCLEQLGRENEALIEVLLAEELDPLSSAITISAVYRCITTGNLDEALKRVRKITEIDPASPLVIEAFMVYYFAKEDWENTLVYLRKMIEEDPTDPYLDMDLAYIYAVTERRSEALKLVEKLKAVPESDRIKGTLLAFVYAGLEDLDDCFRWLEHAYDNHEIFFGWFRSYPLLENVRKDPRWARLLEKAGLPP